VEEVRIQQIILVVKPVGKIILQDLSVDGAVLKLISGKLVESCGLDSPGLV
jgi:hypothetical protein